MSKKQKYNYAQLLKFIEGVKYFMMTVKEVINKCELCDFLVIKKQIWRNHFKH